MHEFEYLYRRLTVQSAQGDRVVAEQESERSGLGQVIKLPKFGLPFPSEIHPDTDSVIAHTCQWALATGLRPDEDAVEDLRRGGIMNAGPRLVPGAPMDVACLVCDWTVWLIVLDDAFDEDELGAQPARARAAIEDVIAAFGGQSHRAAARSPHMTGISEAAADLGRRFAAASPGPAWLARFRHYADDHIWSKVSEAEHRASAGVLDVPAYVTLRRVTSAASAYTSLAEMAAQAVIAERVRESQAWGRMLGAAADTWLGVQDICSCAKEVSSGDDLNLAAVMARSARSTLQQGVNQAYEWVCKRSGDLTDQRAQLEALPRRLGLGGDAEADMTRYLDALELLLGGHITWNSKDNPRYSQVISHA
jgi:hypothetical protein